MVSLLLAITISCDVGGRLIEFLQYYTTPIDKPFFSLNLTDTNKESDKITDNGDGTVAMMGVDIFLPTQLVSVKSSKYFGNALVPLLQQLIDNG